jgi:hypothetical protein
MHQYCCSMLWNAAASDSALHAACGAVHVRCPSGLLMPDCTAGLLPARYGGVRYATAKYTGRVCVDPDLLNYAPSSTATFFACWHAFLVGHAFLTAYYLFHFADLARCR